MSYETISVRMNRSDTSIRWGFSLGRRGNEIIVASVEKDSLSEKAGLRTGDEVVSIFDRRFADFNDAQRTADSARLEITFSLKRFVTSHTCLPWTLTEKDNKLFVEEIPAGLSSQRAFSNTSASNQWSRPALPMTGYSESRQNNYNYSSSTTGGSHGERNIPIQHSPFSSGVNKNSYQSQSTEMRSNYQSDPGRNFHSPSSYTTSMKNSGWNRDRQAELSVGPLKNESYSTQSYSHSGTGAPFGGANNNNSSATGFGGANEYIANGNVRGAKAPQSYSFNDGMTTKPFGVGSGGTPLNQQTFINTTSPIPMGHQSSVSPGGTKIFYHTPSPRTRSQLSPNASVHHLQYNSPMNLYSTEACAEQFSQQTGQNVDAPLSSKTPAYLTSATKRLIEEGDFKRPTTPTQSSSFKRISQAVGEPVH